LKLIDKSYTEMSSSDEDTAVPGPPPLLSEIKFMPPEMKNDDRPAARATITAEDLTSKAGSLKSGELHKRNQTENELAEIEELDNRGILKVFKQGYVMKRVGTGPAVLKRWEVRYLSLREADDKKTGARFLQLAVYTSHYRNDKRGVYRLSPGITTVCAIERDAYDEGRRSNLFGIRLKQGVRKLVFDCESYEVMQDWLATLSALSLEDAGIHSGNRIDADSLKEGWLHKRGGNTKTWKRRYFVLLPQMVAYYKTKGAKRAQGFIPLSKGMVVAPFERGPAYFSVSNPAKNGEGREYVMRCYDEKHRDEWIHALNAAINGE
jgi:hypothetical protein